VEETKAAIETLKLTNEALIGQLKQSKRATQAIKIEPLKASFLEIKQESAMSRKGSVSGVGSSDKKPIPSSSSIPISLSALSGSPPSISPSVSMPDFGVLTVTSDFNHGNSQYSLVRRLQPAHPGPITCW
jgi:hypothetical protein